MKQMNLLKFTKNLLKNSQIYWQAIYDRHGDFTGKARLSRRCLKKDTPTLL